MSYNPEIPRDRYDNYGDREWTRLERDGHGELLYRVHLDILQRYLKPSDTVLEIGAGSGRFTKDIVKMCNELIVGDISAHQIEFNKSKMQELGLIDQIKAFHVIDVLDLSIFENNSFDTIICIGGVINYLLDQEKAALIEMLRVLKPGGTLILGSMSFIGSALYYLDGVRYEKDLLGIEATRWLFQTGLQDGVHYPVPNKHYVHMMRSSELDALFADLPVQIKERSAAGLFSQAGDSALEKARQDPQFWQLLVEQEIALSKLPGTIDSGMNIIYVVEKQTTAS
jgi:ubiquinone/menaquinone biosynthesis C-methylase UbiE